MASHPQSLPRADQTADIFADLEAGAEALTLGQARALPCLRRNGKRLDVSCVYRFTTAGARPSGGGRRVVLESFQQGGTRCVTLPAVLRFLRRLSAVPLQRPADYAAAHVAAEKRLARAGL